MKENDEFKKHCLVVISELERKNHYYRTTYVQREKTKKKIRELWETLKNL